MRTPIQNHRFLVFVVLSFGVLWLSGCKKKTTSRVNFKIAYVDSLSVVYEDEVKRLPEQVREICAGLEADSKGCERMYVLDPTLLRLDLNKDLSLKTTIERGGAKDTDNPKVVNKLIRKHLEEIDVPKEFTKGFTPGRNAPLLVAELLTTKAKNDTILVFSEEGVLESYRFGKKSYRVFKDVDELRKHMLNTLCQNDKVNFTLLMNPPTAQGPTPHNETIQLTSTATTGETTPTTRKTRRQVVYRESQRSLQPPPNGICDFATHTLHEKVVDASGNVSRGKVLVLNCADCGYQVGRR